MEALGVVALLIEKATAFALIAVAVVRWSFEQPVYLVMLMLLISVGQGELLKIPEAIFGRLMYWLVKLRGGDHPEYWLMPFWRPRYVGYLIGDIALAAAAGFGLAAYHRLESQDHWYAGLW